MKTACKMIVLCAACACMCMAADSSAASTAQPGGQDMNADSGLSWGQVILLLTACGGTGTLCWQGSKKLHTMTRIEPQPLEVKQSAEYVTKHEFESYKGEVRDNFKGVHARINNATITLSEMRGKLDKIDNTQQEILNLLLHRHDDK